MAKVTNFVRRIFRSGGKNELAHQRLRRAVAQAKPRQVAEQLELGASPVWRDARAPHELNALLLACQGGDVHILNLLFDWFFHDRAQLATWGPQMYCVTIRSGHWHAFLRLHERNVPQVLAATDAVSPRLPAPVFVAAESGQPQILAFLLQARSTIDWRTYTFGGHSLLSVASRYGHYACVEVLLARSTPSVDDMAFAIDCARRHRQAHVLVLLTSCLPEYNAPVDTDDLIPMDQQQPFSIKSAQSADTNSSDDIVMLLRGRGSLADTDVSDGCRYSSSSTSSSAWLRGSCDPVLGDAMPFSGNSDEAARPRSRRFDSDRQTLDGFAILEAARAADAVAAATKFDTEVHTNATTDCGIDDDALQRPTSSGDEFTWSSSSAPLSNDSNSSSNDEDERWYAMKPLADSCEQLLVLPPPPQSNNSTNSDASTDPFTDFDGAFHDAANGETQEPEVAPERSITYDAPEVSKAPISPVVPTTPMAPMAVMAVPAPPVSHKIISIRSNNFRSYHTLPSITEERHTIIENE